MKIVRCSDVTQEACDCVSEGDDASDIKDDLMDHFAQEHRSLWDMTPKADREEMMELIESLLFDQKHIDDETDN